MRSVFVLTLVLALALVGAPALATQGDLYKKGSNWDAKDYPQHSRPNVDQPGTAWGPSVDLNHADGDCNKPVFAPQAGTVRQRFWDSKGSGWGNAIVWTNSANTEKLFIAHLTKVVRTGPVKAGDLIGRAGATGYMHEDNVGDPCDGQKGAHLHVNRSVKKNGQWTGARLHLNGKAVYAGSSHKSRGALYNQALPNTTGQKKDEPSRNSSFTWRRVTSSAGTMWGNDMWWTQSRSGSNEVARWNFTNLKTGVRYDVWCSVPGTTNAWATVKYRAWAPVVGGGTPRSRTVDQSRGWGWVYIGKVVAQEGKIRITASDTTPDHKSLRIGIDACKVRS